MRPVGTKTFYKARGLGGAPPCAICMGPGSGERAAVQLGFGVCVWLCAAHRSDGFLRRRAGRDLVVSLTAVWEAAGCLTATRRHALRAHLERTARLSQARALPGSYAWPDLRREAEERFARGEPAGRVIADLRGRHRADVATVPSERTMQRWYAERRWREGGAPPVLPGGPAPSGGSADEAAAAPTVRRHRRIGTTHGGDDGQDAAQQERGAPGGLHVRRDARDRHHDRAALGDHDPDLPREPREGVRSDGGGPAAHRGGHHGGRRGGHRRLHR